MDAEKLFPRWEVDLIGDERDLAHLVRYFSAGRWHVFIDERTGQTLMRVNGFAPDASPGAVLATAEETAKILSGVLKTTHQSHRPLTVGGVMRRQEDGTRHVYVTIHETIRAISEIYAEVWRRDACGQLVLQPSVPPRTMALALLTESNPMVAKAMRLCVAADADTWVGLYRLYEVIGQGVCGETAMVARGWTSKPQQDRFRRSANSIHVAGDAARHGSDKFDPPPKPMDLQEAAAYIQMLLQAWLAEMLCV